MPSVNTLTKQGAIAIAILAGGLIGSDRGMSHAVQLPQVREFSVAPQVLPANQAVSDRPAIATLADGNYQFCSQPPPSDWRGGAGVCFNFSKIGDRVDGYYGYPHSDNFICIRGVVKGDRITGKALAVSWAGSLWTAIPETAFKWDAEGHLTLSDGEIVRSAQDREECIDWILFRSAALDTDGFYRYSTPRMTPPSQLCKWK